MKKLISDKGIKVLLGLLLAVFVFSIIISVITTGWGESLLNQAQKSEQHMEGWTDLETGKQIAMDKLQDAIILKTEPGAVRHIYKTTRTDVHIGDVLGLITRCDLLQLRADGELLYSFNSDEQPDMKCIYHYIEIELPNVPAGTVLELTLMSEYENHIHLQHLHRDTPAGNYSYLISVCTPTIVISVVVLIVAVIALFLYFYYRNKRRNKHKELPYLALFCLLSFFFMMTDSGASVLSSASAITRHYLYYGSYMLLPTAYLFFLQEVTQSRSRSTTALILANMLCAVAAVLASELRLLPLMYTSHFFMLLIPLSCVAGIRLLLQKSNRGYFIFVVASVILMGVSAVAVAFFRIGGAVQASLLFSYAMVVFSIGLLITLVASFNRMELKAARATMYQMQREDAEARARLTQINTHFFNNTMNAIRGLVRFDPDAAYKMVGDFCRHTRYQVGAAGNERHTVPFKEELKAIRSIADIYVVCKGGDLKVEYGIEDEDFDIPTLTVEPFVENAIVHGISHGSGEGTVWIRSHKTDDAHIVTVSDDGCGFDLSKPSSRSSSGIDNVKARMAMFEGCSVQLTSEPGMGTTVTLTYPAKLGGRADEADISG